MKVVTTMFILLICFFIGSGIYYFVTQTWTPSPPANTADTTRPNIQSAPISSTAETGATITWRTDKPATSRVILRDPSGVSTEIKPQENLDTSHGVTLSGLQPNTTYSYTVISTDADGKETTSEGELTTLAIADKTVPTISGFNISRITETSAIVTWATNEPATSQVKYGKTETYGLTTPLDSKLTTSHSVTLTQLDPNTTYNFRGISKDASGNEATSTTNLTFKTLAPVQVGNQVGNRAPNFTLKDLNGKDITLSALQGKIVMVNFWATWCDPCKEEMPFFQIISGDWSGKELVILAIAVRDNQDLISVKQYITQKAYAFPALFDSEGQVRKLYRVDTYPTTFFIDTNGIIKEIKKGRFSSPDEIEKILRSL